MLPGLVVAWRSRGCGPASQGGLLCLLFARDDAARMAPNNNRARTMSDHTEQSGAKDEPASRAQDWQERGSVTSRQNYPLSGRLQTSLGSWTFGGHIRDGHLSIRPSVDARIAVAPFLLFTLPWTSRQTVFLVLVPNLTIHIWRHPGRYGWLNPRHFLAAGMQCRNNLPPGRAAIKFVSSESVPDMLGARARLPRQRAPTYAYVTERSSQNKFLLADIRMGN